MVLIGFPRLARSTLSTASSDGGVSHWRLPKRSRPLYFIVRARRSLIRLTDSRTPSSPTRISPAPRGCMENVHRGGHTESIPPQLSLQTANLHRRLLGSSPIAEGYSVEAGAGGVFAHFSSWRIFALPSWIALTALCNISNRPAAPFGVADSTTAAIANQSSMSRLTSSVQSTTHTPSGVAGSPVSGAWTVARWPSLPLSGGGRARPTVRVARLWSAP